MLRRAWKPLAATTALVSVPTYLYYKTRRPAQEHFRLSVPVAGPDGERVMEDRVLPLADKATIDALIRQNAREQSVLRPNGVLFHSATATLAANDPIEDANASAIIERDATDPSAPGDLLFFTVMDGHSGPATSRMLAQNLIPVVTGELFKLINAPSTVKADPFFMSSVRALLRNVYGQPTGLDADTAEFAHVVRNAFTKLDARVVQDPVAHVVTNTEDSDGKKRRIPDLSQNPEAMTAVQRALSGSCALMAILDTAHRNLYVACTGDSRAVAGIWEDKGNGEGMWKVEVLSEDQTARNPEEAKRIRAEHPSDENKTVIRRNRILGGLEPTRAFGDARYKWSAEIQEVLNQAFQIDSTPRFGFKTPPYVTARPVVTHRALDALPTPDLTAFKPRSQLRFLVLATDGLWDQLSSEDAVALVGGHLAGLRGTVPKAELAARVPTAHGARAVEGKLKKVADEQGAWAFEDANVSAHLIRNAFGGGDGEYLRRLLSIPPPLARRYRDDVTVTVVWWEAGTDGDAPAPDARVATMRSKL